MNGRSATIVVIVLVVLLALAFALFRMSEWGISGTASYVASGTTTGVQTYSSPAFGLSFKYDASQAQVAEQGNTIFVYPRGTDPAQGQHVERFAKDPGKSFAEAIRAAVLTDYATSTCTVSVTPNRPEDGYAEAEISYPPPTNSEAPWFATAAGCNERYDKTNGVRFFLYDSTRPDRFYFFDIGQYPILAGENQAWQDTVIIH